MADNFGTLTAQILYELERDVQTYGIAVQRAILSALNYIEEEAYWLLEKEENFTILDSSNVAPLPADFNQLYYVRYLFGNRYYGMTQGFKGIVWSDFLSYRDLIYNSQPQKYSIWANNFYIYPYADGNISFSMYYYYTDSARPTFDTITNTFIYENQNASTYESVWFDRRTIDAVRYKALEIMYRDVLQTPEMSQSYKIAYEEFIANLIIKNNQRQNINILSI